MKFTKEQLSDITDVQVENVNWDDYPDFVDAAISSASWRSTGQRLTEDEVGILNEYHTDFVYESVLESLH